MTPIQFLQRLLEFFEVGERYTKGFFAKTASGAHCASNAPIATCWCLIGACNKLVKEGGDAAYFAHEKASKLLHDEVAKRGFSGLDRFNDAPETTVEVVRQVVRDAMKAAA